MIEYINETIISSRFGFLDRNEGEFFFILSNFNSNYIYQILLEGNTDLFKYEEQGILIDYKLQYVYSKEAETFINSSSNNNFCKSFVSFSSNLIKVNPFVICLDSKLKISEVKRLILKKLLLNKDFNNIFKEFSFDKLVKRFDFFTFMVKDLSIKRDLMLAHNKDQEILESLAKNYKILNILIEDNRDNTIDN